MFKQLVPFGALLFISHLSISPSFGSPKAATPPAAASLRLVSTVSPTENTPRFQAPPDAFTPIVQTIKLAPEEQEFITRINAERSSRGLNVLTIDPLLVNAARGHSREMCDLNYFDHHSPTVAVRTPMDRYLASLHQGGEITPRFALCGENIYYSSILDDEYNVAYGHTALMNSPGHRANILEPRYTKVGVGIYRDTDGQFWVTEMFLRDKE